MNENSRVLKLLQQYNLDIIDLSPLPFLILEIMTICKYITTRNIDLDIF